MSDDGDEYERVDEDAEAVQRDDSQTFVPSTDDPIQYLQESLLSNWVTEWRFVGSRHGVYRIGEQSVRDGTVRSRLNFDDSWECDVCRPFKEWKEGQRILTGFEDREMWVSVVVVGDRERAVRTARRHRTDYVALPIIVGGEVALLTTGPLFDRGIGSQIVEAHEWFVENVMMPLRWSGSISASEGFLPAARTYEFWEAYHKDTGRRCWHAHDDKDDARRCAVETGELLDGTSKGWYVRGCSEWRMLGRIGVPGFRLSELLNEFHVPSWEKAIRGEAMEQDRMYVEFGPILWDDPRFVKLREAAKWTTRPGFRPPPFALTMRVDVDSGKMTGSA
jgi:hypothetical protein